MDRHDVIYIHICTHCNCACVYHSARNKDQKLVGHFLKIGYFYRLLITVPLKMYRKYDRPKWILVSQMPEEVGHAHVHVAFKKKNFT